MVQGLLPWRGLGTIVAKLQPEEVLVAFIEGNKGET